MPTQTSSKLIQTVSTEEESVVSASETSDPMVLWDLWEGDETIEELLVQLD